MDNYTSLIRTIFTFSSFGTRIFRMESLLNVAFTFRGSMTVGSVTVRLNSPQKHSCR